MELKQAGTLMYHAKGHGTGVYDGNQGDMQALLPFAAIRRILVSKELQFERANAYLRLETASSAVESLSLPERDMPTPLNLPVNRFHSLCSASLPGRESACIQSFLLNEHFELLAHTK